MPSLASKQPRVGDVVIYCVHAMNMNGTRGVLAVGTHWFETSTSFTAPSGEEGVTQWIVCCEHCYRGLGGDLVKLKDIPVGGHLTCGKIPPFIVDDAS